MTRVRGAALHDLLSGANRADTSTEALAEDAVLLHSFAAPEAQALIKAVTQIADEAPFRHMVTPGGYRMSVAMTNCGRAGWITDRRGYRYDAVDPTTQRPWPAMPMAFSRLAARAAEAAGFGAFEPDACLINRYEPGARLTLHQDKNEREATRSVGARLAFHGIEKLDTGEDALCGPYRFNLTLRKAL